MSRSILISIFPCADNNTVELDLNWHRRVELLLDRLYGLQTCPTCRRYQDFIPNCGCSSTSPVDVHACPAACKIIPATVFGREIIERWLDRTSTVVTPTRFAIKRSRFVSIVRSSVDTAYYLGFVRQAACIVLAARSSRLNGSWTAWSTRAFAGGTSPAKSRKNASSLNCPHSPDQTMPAEAGGFG